MCTSAKNNDSNDHCSIYERPVPKHIQCCGSVRQAEWTKLLFLKQATNDGSNRKSEMQSSLCARMNERPTDEELAKL